MKRQIFALLFLFVKSAMALAGEADLHKALLRINKSSLATFEVEKKTKSELLGKETKAPGTIYISAKKFRWDSDGEEKSKIIYDGNSIWTIQEPPKGFKAPPQITKMKLNKKSEGQVFINNLFQQDFKSQFEVIKKMKIENDWEFFLKPKNKNTGVDQLVIKINDQNEIKEISYVDEIQNKISVAVSRVTLSKKQNSKLFQFKPPMGSQVNEL